MRVTSFSASSMEALKQQLDSTIADQYQPSLAMIFCSPDLPYKELPAVFESYNIDLVGCTTMGEICNEDIVTGSMSVLLFEMNPAYYTVMEIEGNNQELYEKTELIGKKASEKFQNPGFILFTGGSKLDGDYLVNRLKENMGLETTVYGGLAGMKDTSLATYCFGRTRCTNKGMIVLAIDMDKITMKGLSYSGWEEMGATHQITKSIGNIVYEINGKPASDEFEKYFGKLRYDLSTDEDKKFEVISGQFPLKILKQEGVAIMRSVLIHDAVDRSLVLAGGVQEGDSFKFCTAPDYDVIDNTIKQFGELKSRTGEVDAVIMVSCGARLSVFGPMLEDEIEEIYQFWNKPMAGFFAFGEIGNTNMAHSDCEFHNVTCSLVTLTEK